MHPAAAHPPQRPPPQAGCAHGGGRGRWGGRGHPCPYVPDVPAPPGGPRAHRRGGGARARLLWRTPQRRPRAPAAARVGTARLWSCARGGHGARWLKALGPWDWLRACRLAGAARHIRLRARCERCRSWRGGEGGGGPLQAGPPGLERVGGVADAVQAPRLRGGWGGVRAGVAGGTALGALAQAHITAGGFGVGWGRRVARLM